MRGLLVVRGVVVVLLVVLVGVCGCVGVAWGSDGELGFGVEPGSFVVEPGVLGAGAHGDLTTSFVVVHNRFGETAADVRSVVVDLPVGFVGDRLAVAGCSRAQLLTQEGTVRRTECPFGSQVGTVTITMNVSGLPQTGTVPLYNMELDEPGAAAEFGFNFNGILTQLLVARVRPGDAGVTVSTPNIAGAAEVSKSSVTVWGVPGESSHDVERGRECLAGACKGGGVEWAGPVLPFLVNPSSCAGGLRARLEMDSWADPEEWVSAETGVGPMVECDRVPFAPSMEVHPGSQATEAASGLSLAFGLPDGWVNPVGLGTANVKDVQVTLPEGFTVNPSAAAGLVGCTPQQLSRETYDSPAGAGCPAQAKVGSVVVQTPVLSETLEGSVYMAAPFDNPFGSLLGMYVVVKDAARGIIVTLAGKVTPDPVSGRLVVSFDEDPQLPFTRFTVNLKQGAGAPLVSPPACGSYTVGAQLAPWSAPSEARSLTGTLQIKSGVGGGACPAAGGLPFAPKVVAGTMSNTAGSYSPLYLAVEREDGEAEIRGLSTVMAPGLSGDLTGIPFCPQADIQAAGKVTGAQELEHPSCPAASQVGHIDAGAGVGQSLAWTTGKLYLAGPYDGAPLSLVSIVSAKAGPFDLGTVVVRMAVNVNPITAQVEVTEPASQQIPRIIDGIVVHLRDIRVFIDRAHFAVNPTSCARMHINSTITASQPTNPADQTTDASSTRFQAAGCRALRFNPKMQVSTNGRTSRKDGASLQVKLTFPQGKHEANIARVKVKLPRQLPSRMSTLEKACTHTQFNTSPSGCPPESIVGHATANTPLLPEPLAGNAYFVSNAALSYPELVIVLHGYNLTIDLHGQTHINAKTDITTTTFNTVPDQPITSFNLTLPEGPHSALAAPGNKLCQAGHTITRHKRVAHTKHHHTTYTHTTTHHKIPPLIMPVTLTAQNGATHHKHIHIHTTNCNKHHQAQAPQAPQPQNQIATPPKPSSG